MSAMNVERSSHTSHARQQPRRFFIQWINGSLRGRTLTHLAWRTPLWRRPRSHRFGPAISVFNEQPKLIRHGARLSELLVKVMPNPVAGGAQTTHARFRARCGLRKFDHGRLHAVLTCAQRRQTTIKAQAQARDEYKHQGHRPLKR